MATEGNKFWQLRSKHGRDKLFKSPEALWEAACEYFKWCDDNPLIEEKLFQYQGEVVTGESKKMMAYTLTALCLYLCCSESYFRKFEDNNKNSENLEDFITVITRIQKTIYSQKFVGAAADLLNPNIIARDLGLKDAHDLNHGGQDGNPIEFYTVKIPDNGRNKSE